MVTISVITPTFNRATLLEAAIDGVTAQMTPSDEHIVVDGASTDDTLQRLQQFPHLQIISEPDCGLYDAINKGIRRARGDVICLVNSDDLLMPGALAAVRHAFEENPGASCVCGRVRLGDVAGHGQNDRELGTDAMQRLRAGDIISGLPLTNARFFRRAVFGSLGGFEQEFPVLADRDFLGRSWLAEVRTITIGHALYRYGVHEQSLSFGMASGQAAYNMEAVRLASTRLGQSTSTSERAFYRRWAGWAIGYMLLRALRDGSFRAACAATGPARQQLPQWPLHFVAQLVWHLATRNERRGRSA